jgi:adenine deaminase
MAKTVIRGGKILDPLTMEILDNEALVIKDGIISEGHKAVEEKKLIP